MQDRYGIKLTMTKHGSIRCYSNGIRCKYLGEGISRTVYVLPDGENVVKIETENNRLGQSRIEWDNYQRIAKTRLKRYVTKTYEPFSVEMKLPESSGSVNRTVIVQKLVTGSLPMNMHEWAAIDKLATKFSKKFGISDIHENNCLISANGEIKIFDLGLMDD